MAFWPRSCRSGGRSLNPGVPATVVSRPGSALPFLLRLLLPRSLPRSRFDPSRPACLARRSRSILTGPSRRGAGAPGRPRQAGTAAGLPPHAPRVPRAAGYPRAGGPPPCVRGVPDTAGAIPSGSPRRRRPQTRRTPRCRVPHDSYPTTVTILITALYQAHSSRRHTVSLADVGADSADFVQAESRAAASAPAAALAPCPLGADAHLLYQPGSHDRGEAIE
jgi:hypothetical protein